MNIIITILVTFFAGMGAGLGTGFAGMSAAAVISPMLITFLHMDPYMAIGIALSSDVLASAVSAYTYGKNKNLDIRNGLIMMASVLLFTVVGSLVASHVPSMAMGNFSVIMTFLLGIKFIVKPVMTTKEAMLSVSPEKRVVQSIISGIIIGFICGFVGAGGGMMMLLILTSVLGYELKTAVGTSVFIMSFTALTGAVSHFTIGGTPDPIIFTLCVVFTLLWARIAAIFANKASAKTLNRATGVVLAILGGIIMVFKFKLGNPFETDAVVENINAATGNCPIGEITIKDKGEFTYTYTMDNSDMVLGLGENVRGINKRGFQYISFCSDEPHQRENTKSLYGAHNFFIVVKEDEEESFGVFIDYPGKITFDLGFTKCNELKVSSEKSDLYFYLIQEKTLKEIVGEFRRIIGQSYIAPFFAFGFGQSRWGYKSKEDVEYVIKRHRDEKIPLDMVYLDIDYMENYKDFTIDQRAFPDFKKWNLGLKEQGIRLIPIIDAGIKIQKDYDIYEQGKEGDYFCKDEDGKDFAAAVWPGLCHFPDFLREDTRKWFGDSYKRLTDMGIEGFWNDMNEPAIFYSGKDMEDIKEKLKEMLKLDNMNHEDIEALGLTDMMLAGEKNYSCFYHKDMLTGELTCHRDLHNLYGYNMTRALGEAAPIISPDKRLLIFSRASYIGAHRYGGIWMGDNTSCFSHLLMNLQMLPSLNMCGFLYTGADIGGFGEDTSRELLLRWLALGVFTPLMRNHSCNGTRSQEFYRFEGSEDFRSIIQTRYRLIPYIYSEFMKAALNNEMMFRPLVFDFGCDKRARQVEDQLLLGDEVMIAPIYTQNATGRYVYLPEEMLFVKFLPEGEIYTESLDKGDHYINVELNQVPMFIRKGEQIPLADEAQNTDSIDYETIKYIGYTNNCNDYYLYKD